jgi:hypothetical protein
VKIEDRRWKVAILNLLYSVLLFLLFFERRKLDAVIDF